MTTASCIYDLLRWSSRNPLHDILFCQAKHGLWDLKNQQMLRLDPNKFALCLDRSDGVSHRRAILRHTFEGSLAYNSLYQDGHVDKD